MYKTPLILFHFNNDNNNNTIFVTHFLLIADQSALFKNGWNTDKQPAEEKDKCSLKVKNGKKKIKVKCFGMKQEEDYHVTMHYRGEDYDTDDFCILINPEATKPTDHFAEICTEAKSNLLA